MTKTGPTTRTLPAYRPRSLKKGAFLNWTSLAVNFGVSLILTPTIIHNLGASGYGMWTLIQSFSGYYGLINLGLASAMQRFIGRDLATEDGSSLQTTVGTATTFFACTGAVIFCAALALRDWISVFFEIPFDEAAAFQSTILFCVIAVICDFFGSLVTSLLVARERFDVSNALGIGRQLFQSAGIILVLRIHPSTSMMAMIVCMVSLFSLMVGWLLVQRLYPAVSFLGKGASLSRLKELLHYGSSTVLVTISNIVRLRLGNIVIAKTAGLHAVGAFSVASNLVVNMSSIVSSSLNVLNPRFTRLHTQENKSEIKRLYRMALFVSATISCGMGMMVFVFGERFILLWIGESFLPAVAILHVLTAAYIVALAQSPSWNLMLAVAKHHYMARVTIAEAAAVLVLGLWLSQAHGALGFAWGTAVAMLISKTFLHAPYAARIGDLTLPQYLAPMAAPFITGTFLVGISKMLALPFVLRTNGIVTFLLLAAAWGTLFLGTVIVLTAKKDYAPAFVSKYFVRTKGS